LLSDNGRDVSWWIRNPERRDEVRQSRRNGLYHPDTPLNASVELCDDLASALASADLIFVAIPSQSVRGFWTRHHGDLGGRSVVVSTAKGIEEQTAATMDQVMSEVMGPTIATRCAVLSGPTFAREMLTRSPTAAVVASIETDVAVRVQHEISTDWFRAYTSEDVIGVELAGAVKNVMAIAAGIIDGLGLGHNARAALITRGLAEIRRLGAQLGAQSETFAGLAGMGDLVLTCTGDLSRNRTVGKRLGQGQTLRQILDSMREVAEGVRTTRSVHQLSRTLGVEMPIVDQVHKMLYEDKPPSTAIAELMQRTLKAENP
jgi:glycerol-3-phosphate dehydrogenase (NAD(P)+)